MHVRDYLGGHGSTFNCSIARVAPQRAAILAKIVIYDSSTLQYCCIRSICHNQVQVSHLFRLNRLGVQRIYERRSVAILIVPALNCFVPVLELYPHVSTPWNYSTRGKKNSRKYGQSFPLYYGTSSHQILTIAKHHMFGLPIRNILHGVSRDISLPLGPSVRIWCTRPFFFSSVYNGLASGDKTK